MATVNAQIVAELGKLIAEAIQAVKDEMGAGRYATFEQYKLNAGRILGLQDALALAEQAQSDIQKR